MSDKKNESSQRKSRNGMTVALKSDYKQRIDREARNLSSKYDKRVTTTELLYFLIDNYFDHAVKQYDKKLKGG